MRVLFPGSTMVPGVVPPNGVKIDAVTAESAGDGLTVADDSSFSNVLAVGYQTAGVPMQGLVLSGIRLDAFGTPGWRYGRTRIVCPEATFIRSPLTLHALYPGDLTQYAMFFTYAYCQLPAWTTCTLRTQAGKSPGSDIRWGGAASENYIAAFFWRL